ncbi:TPA: uridylate kinase [Salmonella enterica]|uniref:Uridylate kinase n=1 Tax=Salmonella enterica TaxID=28901 RepID=A0A744HFS5_SALER|nr:uridylate kinase [Salmonella enterica]HAF4919921.1 uridylate kinase [Salmonella enterica]
MFSGLISHAPDFDHQIGSCINAINQDDAIGQILVFERMRGRLHMRHIASADLQGTDIDNYEMVVFDCGNASGGAWKHVFFPQQREHYFVYEN